MGRNAGILFMKHVLFVIAAVSVWGGVARADALSHMPETRGTLSQALHSAKVQAHQGVNHQEQQTDEQNLRRIGLSAETVRDGLWAVSHRPHSPCAQYIRQLTADAKGSSAALLQSDQRLVTYVENSGICER
ncbi:hypothetical protein DTJ06_05980 [Parasaccharibacter sp. TMW 2.1886]|nr:hypothetical protein [Parasaccharibacter sp. TMW 2.1886]